MDVILLPSLPKTASLPVGTVLAIKERLQNGTYDFDFVYYTESDQVYTVYVLHMYCMVHI
jgi:hypothetical protein